MIVPTPDINRDGCVNTEDLALVAEHWLDMGCELDNDFCNGMDLDHNGAIDMMDFSLISSAWNTCGPAIPEGLISHWTMDDNAAGKTVLDASDNHFNGTAQRNTSLLTAAGKIGTALAFDGTTDQIACGANTALLPDAWTVCAWVKCADAATPTLLSFGGIRPSIKLQNNNAGKPSIIMGSNNYRSFDASAWTTLKDGQWHHVAFALSGSAQNAIASAQMVLDGTPVAAVNTVATGPQSAKSGVFLGNTDAAGTQRFKGAMDDVMLFDRVLSQEEIQRVMNRTP
jgi:hypothetical protein